MSTSYNTIEKPMNAESIEKRRSENKQKQPITNRFEMKQNYYRVISLESQYPRIFRLIIIGKLRM